MYSVESMCSQGWQGAPKGYYQKSQTNWALVVLVILLIIIILWWAFSATNGANNFNFGNFGAARRAAFSAPVVTLSANPNEKPEENMRR